MTTIFWIIYIVTIIGLALELRGQTRPEFVEVRPEILHGTAAWMGDECAGRIMANGKAFDPADLTCATWDFPLGAKLLVSRGARVIVVTVTDRGPAAGLRAHGRIIDLSYAAFNYLAEPRLGVISVSVQQIVEQEDLHALHAL